jgi:hypothetical protein
LRLEQIPHDVRLGIVCEKKRKSKAPATVGGRYNALTFSGA